MRTETDFFRYILLLFSLLILASCTSPNRTNILIGTDDCKPPCWIEINPGITTKEEMVKLLSDREKSKDGRLKQLESDITWWQSITGHDSYFYSSDNGVISKIEIDLRQTEIYLEDVIGIVGTPSKLDIGKISDGYFFATIFYPESGLAFVVGGNSFDASSEAKKFPIGSDMLVVKGLFFQPSEVVSMVNLLYGENAVPQALSDIQVWNGYGIYSE